MATTKETETESPYILSLEEGRALFDREARHWAGISGEEFLRRWDAGEYQNIPDTPEGRRVMSVIYLIPFARQEP